MAAASTAVQSQPISQTVAGAINKASPETKTGLAPLLSTSFAYAAGIAFGRYVWNPATWWIAAWLGFVFFSLWGCARGGIRLARSLTLILFALSGALGFELASAPGWQSNNLFAALSDGREVTVTAHVIRAGIFQGGAVPRQSVDVESESVESGGSVYSLQFGIRLSVYAAPVEMSEEELPPHHVQNRDALGTPVASGPELSRFSYGERLRLRTHLRKPRNFMDAGAFDYREYLAQQNIFALGSVRADRLEMLPGLFGSRLGFWRSAIRGSLLKKIHELWQGRDGELMSAMLLGDRTGIDHDTSIEYQRTGAYHILVVAGLKVGIVAFALLWLFNFLRAPEWLATPLTILAAVIYAWITDANAPVVRATVMLTVYLIARALYRERSPLNAVGIAGLALLVWEPRALFDASFQMTFISILAIAGIALPIMERSSRPLRRALEQLDSTDYDFALSAKLVQLRLDVRMMKARLAAFLGMRAAEWAMVGGAKAALAIYDVLLISLVLQLGLALPMAFYFHRAVTLGLPANVVVVPLHALLLPAAALAVAASYVSIAFAQAMALAPAALLHATNLVVERLAHWRFAGTSIGDVRVATPMFLPELFAVGALIFALLVARRRAAMVVTSLVALLAAAVWIAWPPRPQLRTGVLEITALDVGQGDSLLVVSPEGRTLLVDAGGELGAPGGTRFDMGEEVVSPALWARGITHLDAVALTHAHADHIGGMRAVIENFHPRELWLGPEPDTAAMRALLREAATENVQVIRRELGEKIDFGGSEIDVLGPPADWEVNRDKAQNNDSLVMLAKFGATSSLLEGDAEKKVEHELAEEDPAADLLKVGHHGSASSTTPELLAAVHPKLAVISAGFRSPFHHPRPEVLKRLEDAGVRTFRTDTMGETTFYLDGKRAWEEDSAR